MFAFYLGNQQRLFPRRACSLGEFLRRMGDRSTTTFERFAALFTLFAFFFAGVQLLYFYIAWLNWLEDFELLGRLRSVPTAVLLLLGMLAIGFAALTYRDFQRRQAGPLIDREGPVSEQPGSPAGE